MSTRCKCDIKCIACEKGMYGECLGLIDHTEDFIKAVSKMGETMPQAKRRMKLLVGAGASMGVDLAAAIRKLEADHGIIVDDIKIETKAPVKAPVDDSYFPLFSEIMAAAMDFPVPLTPPKHNQTDDWRGNGKQRARRRK